MEINGQTMFVQPFRVPEWNENGLSVAWTTGAIDVETGFGSEYVIGQYCEAGRITESELWTTSRAFYQLLMV
jgi:hypothetical protein